MDYIATPRKLPERVAIGEQTEECPDDRQTGNTLGTIGHIGLDKRDSESFALKKFGKLLRLVGHATVGRGQGANQTNVQRTFHANAQTRSALLNKARGIWRHCCASFKRFQQTGAHWPLVLASVRYS